MCYFACQQMFSSHLCLITSVNQLEIILYVSYFHLLLVKVCFMSAASRQPDAHQLQFVYGSCKQG